ncbi:putative integral membrane protein [Actinoplanes missouriensis 431]|uniref:Putative integral membrane protein n=1 Tax=Actinoplanes missouriensis (strain ATCC 14538 / DSM 43046 / CBS 188.64 / JCM 3121 / NBRC 102363 / NCIMB 12654 / NRRL B-3342 / UNCC 431) TaxID=512565 RepID=I0H7I6_ACTM4|nr:phage holin family protein [Actinoplanes missouriensis]BAL88973.1 putative integral membrane protein [Actinoplanes missouriensis 431]
MTHTDARTEQASTAELVSRLSEQVTTLVRDELALARIEMVEKGKKAGKGAGLLGGAGVIAAYGLGALFVTIGAALALVMPVWAAALIVTVVLFAGAGVAALIGKKEVQQAVPPSPEQAMESGRRDVDALMTAARNGRHS